MADQFATSFSTLNYSGMLFNKGNTRTPLSSVIGGRAKTTNHVEFIIGQEYVGGGNGSQPEISEGASLTAPDATVATRTQSTNVTQIFMESVGISYAKQSNMGTLSGVNVASQTANPINELDFQVAVKMQKVARDLEYTFINGEYSKALSDATANKTRGLVSAITTNTKAMGSKPLGLWDIADMLKKVYESNAPTQNLVLWCDAVTMFQINADAVNNGLIMTANESVAPNSREMEILKTHFPSCFHSDGSFDLARFQEFLSDKVAVTNEGYELRFLGKNYTTWYAENKNQLGKLEGYKFCDAGGVYAGSRSVHNPGKQGYYYDVIHPVTGKPCTPPLMGYRFPEESMKLLIAQDRIIYGEDENKIIELKQYLRDYEDKLSSVISLDSRSGANIIRGLFDNKNVFKNPKTPYVLEEILPFVISNGDIVLDFFSGSATTAHAVMNMNVADNGNRRYILVQLPEPIKKDSEGAKAGFSTIDQIGMERIIRAARKIKEENTDSTADLGFRHYTLAEPSSTTLDKLEQFSPDDNGMFVSNTILEDFGLSTVLATWLVRDGYGFTAPVEAVDFAGYTGYYMGKHLYLITQNLSNEAIAAITEKYETDGSFNPENVVLFGYSFKWTEMESLKTNLARLKDTEKNLRINFDIRY